MEKLNLIIVLTAILLVGLALAFKFLAPTGAAAASVGGGVLSGNIVTVIAVIAIAGIVILTLYKKFE